MYLNLTDSSFLCLDIGQTGVHGIAHRVRGARIVKSAVFSVDGTDTVFAIKSVVDELENQIGTHFDSAYITGNFGASEFEMTVQSTAWDGEHKITAMDVKNQISRISPSDGFYPMHIVPLRYDGLAARNMLTPVGHSDRRLTSVFGVIFYDRLRMDEIMVDLRRAHIQSAGFFDPSFVCNAAYRKKKTVTLFIDLGAEFTTASIWTDRGPVAMAKIPGGGTLITNDIAEKLNIDASSADRIKRAVASLTPMEMDRFTPADTAYDFSRADVSDIVLPHMVEIVEKIQNSIGTAIEKYRPTEIILTGGGADTYGATEFFENAFTMPVTIAHSDAAVRALATYIWAMQSARVAAYLARREKWDRRADKIKRLFRRRRRAARIIPIMPSTLCFDMRRATTYSTFRAGGISMIHVDIMDGFYVDRIAGSIAELKAIRSQTTAHLHVHLMTESPSVWAADAIAAGADTVIVSTNTSGVRAALHEIRAAGRRAGIALNPESNVAILKPILRDVDEVMVMSVTPGAAGQKFDMDAVKKIEVLDAARKKYGLKFKISVDGGINDVTAPLCWAAGADALVSGSYLANAHDFPLAVQSLMPDAQSNIM